MPVAKVNCLQYLYSPTFNTSISILTNINYRSNINCMHIFVPFGFSKGSHLTSGKLHLYSHKGIVYLNIYVGRELYVPK
jgi:hypothetical protein